MWTDGQTDEQTDWGIPINPLNFVGWYNNNVLFFLGGGGGINCYTLYIYSLTCVYRPPKGKLNGDLYTEVNSVWKYRKKYEMWPLWTGDLLTEMALKYMLYGGIA